MEKKAPKTSSVITPLLAMDKAGRVSPEITRVITIINARTSEPKAMPLKTLFFEPFSLFKASITGINKATAPSIIVTKEGVENRSTIYTTISPQINNSIAITIIPAENTYRYV